jgi:hypothetical protein
MSVAVANVKYEVSSSTSPSAASTYNAADGSGSGQNKNVTMHETPSMIKKPNGFPASIRKESTTTPRTEASSPDPHAQDLDMEEENHPAVNDNSMTRDMEKCSPKKNEEEYETMPLSQTDQHIHQLDKDGELNEIAGSQSMLSQELSYYSESGDDDKNLQLSEQKETSLSLAKRIGLLSSTQEDECEEDEKLPGPSTPKRSTCGISMLSRAGNNGAPDLASFSAKKEMIASEGKPRMDITDTPVRESEGFGSLLDAVAKITEQEVSEEGEDALAWRHASLLDPCAATDQAYTPVRRKRNPSARASASLSPTRKSPRKAIGNLTKRKIPMALPVSGSTKKRKTLEMTQRRKAREDPKKATQSKKADDAKEAQAAAKRAAALAERAITDPVLAKRLLLSMALVRENPRSAPEVLPGPGHVIEEGFVWAHYPPLETGMLSNALGMMDTLSSGG